MISLHAELDARPQSRADFARLAAGWLTDARRRLFPDLDLGPAGAVPAWLRVHQQPEALGGTATPYTDRVWRRTLAGSGAFDEVRELPGGRVYLRATGALEDFEGGRSAGRSGSWPRCCYPGGPTRSGSPACGPGSCWTPTPTPTPETFNDLGPRLS
jgi:hypothetical protein